MKCHSNNYECPYHACMDDGCQYAEVMKNGTDFGVSACGKPYKQGQYDESEKNLLTTLYPNNKSTDIARLLGRSRRSIFNMANKLKLKKSKVFYTRNCNLHELGKAYRFPKGHTPANKGKKQTEYMSAETIKKTVATRFQKGHLPHNTLHDFTITERKDKNGHTYKYIRIALGKWVPYHRHIWEKEYGKIPKGSNIQFKDGDTLNCHINNLYMIDRATQLKEQNSMHARYPEEIKQAIYLKGVLQRQINKKLKENE